MKDKNTIFDGMDQRTRMHRRRLLRGMSALTLGLTTNIWKSATAFGEDTKANSMHFFGMFSPNGTVPKAFFSGSTAKVSQLALGEILQPLAPYKDNVIVMKGIQYRSIIENELFTFEGYSGGRSPASGDKNDKGDDLYQRKPGGPHMKGPGAFLTGGSLLHGTFGGANGPAGWADRISLDQFLAQRIGKNSRFPSLEFGVILQREEPLRCISFSGSNLPNLPVQDPWSVYARMFKDSDKSEEELKAKLLERQSILDGVKAEILSLQSRLGSEDKAKLDAHLTNVRTLEIQLANSAGSVCKPFTMPAKIEIDKYPNFPTLGRLHTDLMILAHSCGFTQISTFMWAGANSDQEFSWLGVNTGHHALSHSDVSDLNASHTKELIAINKWTAEQMAYLLGKLKEAPSADGKTIFDNTVMLWGTDIAEGSTHSHKNIPFVIAGGAGGYFKMGRSLNLDPTPHNDVLVSVANAMGCPDVKTFGIPGVCRGPLSELTS